MNTDSTTIWSRVAPKPSRTRTVRVAPMASTSSHTTRVPTSREMGAARYEERSGSVPPCRAWSSRSASARIRRASSHVRLSWAGAPTGTLLNNPYPALLLAHR